MHVYSIVCIEPNDGDPMALQAQTSGGVQNILFVEEQYD